MASICCGGNTEGLGGIRCLRGLGRTKEHRPKHCPQAMEAAWTGSAQNIRKGTLASCHIHKHVHQLQPLGNRLY